MPEEIQNQTEQKNTVAVIGMWFSISGLVATALIILGFICLFNESLVILGALMLFIGGILGLFSLGFFNYVIGFILGIIGLFYKPRGKARIAILIPIFAVIIPTITISTYIWSSVKAPAFEFKDWAATRFEEIDEENFDDDKFEIILQKEANDIVNSKTEQERKEAYESSTGSNAIEKVSYLFFDILKQTLDNSLEKYYNNELHEIDNNIDNENNIIDVDAETTNNEEVDTTENEVVEEENVEVFSDSEKDDIEQIIDILE